MLQRTAPLLRALTILCLLTSVSACSNDDSVLLDKIERGAATCPDGPTTYGIDVSKWQGVIDWDKVKADGVVYAFIRATDGFYEDPDYPFNWSEAKRVGIIRGTYQYFRPAKDPVAQAELLLKMMGPLDAGDLPPVLDVESTDDQSAAVIVEKIHAWIQVIEKATGRTPIIYSGLYFWNDRVKSTDFSNYPLWVPQYGPTCPTLPNAWDVWTFFQFSSSGTVSGIKGNVDENQFNGDVDALKKFVSSTTISCGDGMCNLSERESCAEDCPVCEEIPALGRIVDDKDICFEPGGDLQYWRVVEDDGWESGLLWTKTTDNANPANYALWHLIFELGAEYRVEAYLKPSYAESKKAVYQIRHNGIVDSVVIDQSLADGWLEIGTFVFAAGGDQWVRLNDNTGEPNSSDTQLVADAIRVTPLVPPVVVEDANNGDADVVTPDLAPAPEVTIDDDLGSPDTSQSTDLNSGGDLSKESASSSGCQQSNDASPAHWLWIILAAFAVIRQRRFQY